MEKTELTKGQKYRILTRWGESITKFWGIDQESGNPFFVVHEFPIMMIPWPAILELDPVPMDTPEKFS
jgi:hypothetical protein